MSDPMLVTFAFDGGWADLIWHLLNIIGTVGFYFAYVRERRKNRALKPAADVLDVLAKIGDGNGSSYSSANAHRGDSSLVLRRPDEPSVDARVDGSRPRSQ